MSRLIDLLPRSRGATELPRLTTRKTVEVIAEKTGGDPSKIMTQLDKDRARRHGKRGSAAGRNPFGSLEYAVDYAVSRLGAARVATILQVNEWSLRKGTDPNQPERKLPDFGLRSLLKLIKVLKDEGHTEYFSVAMQETGDATAAVEHLPSLHHALTLSCVTHGDLARAIAEAVDLDSESGISAAEASAILDAIARHQDMTRLLQEQVLATAKINKGTVS